MYKHILLCLLIYLAINCNICWFNILEFLVWTPRENYLLSCIRIVYCQYKDYLYCNPGPGLPLPAGQGRPAGGDITASLLISLRAGSCLLLPPPVSWPGAGPGRERLQCVWRGDAPPWWQYTQWSRGHVFLSTADKAQACNLWFYANFVVGNVISQVWAHVVSPWQCGAGPGPGRVMWRGPGPSWAQNTNNPS